jgi:hypothetical protein
MGKVISNEVLDEKMETSQVVDGGVEEKKRGRRILSHFVPQ